MGLLIHVAAVVVGSGCSAYARDGGAATAEQRPLHSALPPPLPLPLPPSSAHLLPAFVPAATPLLSLRTAASSNWGAATQALNGSAWEGLSPCGGDGAGGAPPWKGVTCNNQGQVTELALPGLGLQGTLPYALAALPSLQRLDLSANAFAGSIPASWLATYGFPNLTHIDLGSNKLTGACGVGRMVPGCTLHQLIALLLHNWRDGCWHSA